jgi:hypothetical protein
MDKLLQPLSNWTPIYSGVSKAMKKYFRVNPQWAKLYAGDPTQHNAMQIYAQAASKRRPSLIMLHTHRQTQGYYGDWFLILGYLTKKYQLLGSSYGSCSLKHLFCRESFWINRTVEKTRDMQSAFLLDMTQQINSKEKGV